MSPGRLSLTGANLDSFIWERAGRAVATGTLDLSANFEATGRSPAGLISALTGGGAINIHSGEVRYVNPSAVSLVIGSSDLGQQFTDDALNQEFTGYIDAGTMPFDEAEAAFSIAAGTVRVKSSAIDSAKAKAVGSAAVDLNAMTLDSDWTLTFDPSDTEVDGAVPQVGLVFRGPLNDPARTIDTLQFGSYLNIRQEERIQRILAEEEASRLEKDRFNRLKRKLREDADRRDREAREAAEAAARAEEERHAAAAAALEKLEAFHVNREILIETRAAAEVTASREATDRALTAKAAAEAAAKAAAETARSARAAAADAAKLAAERTAAAAAAAATAEKAAADRAAADRALAQAEAKADAAKAAAAASLEAASGKADADAVAKAAVQTAAADRAAAEKAAAEASAAADAAAAAAAKLDADAAAAARTAADKASAEKAGAAALAAAKAAVDAAGGVLGKATADRIAAEKSAAEAAAAAATASEEVDAAIAGGNAVAANKAAAEDALKAAADKAAAAAAGGLGRCRRRRLCQGCGKRGVGAEDRGGAASCGKDRSGA